MSDKQRAEFEKWFKENHTQNVQKVNGEYAHGATERLWQAWQAAIASVVVEIPSFFSDRYETDIIYSDDMEKALDRAGIRYE